MESLVAEFGTQQRMCLTLLLGTHFLEDCAVIKLVINPIKPHERSFTHPRLDEWPILVKGIKGTTVSVWINRQSFLVAPKPTTLRNSKKGQNSPNKHAFMFIRRDIQIYSKYIWGIFRHLRPRTHPSCNQFNYCGVRNPSTDSAMLQLLPKWHEVVAVMTSTWLIEWRGKIHYAARNISLHCIGRMASRLQVWA